jgi:uncharacterized protein (DUF1015 family)
MAATENSSEFLGGGRSVAILRSFRALRPDPARAAAVAAVPYDVVSTAEARELAAGNHWSFLHVTRAEIALPDDADPHADAVYDLAAQRWAAFRSEVPFLAEEEPALYVHTLRMGDHEQTGVAGCASVDEYEEGIVRKHELTRPDKEDDRTRHIVRTRAQTGPVFLAYHEQAEIDVVVAAVRQTAPTYEFTAADGVEHQLWRADERASLALASAFARVPSFYIADGHHRAASAARARWELVRSGLATREASYFLATAFPARDLRILPYNRVVRDWGPSGTADGFLRALRERASGARAASRMLDEATNASVPGRHGVVSAFVEGAWLRFELPPPPSSEPTAALDAERLQLDVLAPLLGITDPRTDARIAFVGGIRGTAELEAQVQSGRAVIAFSLHPVSMAELMSVSDAGLLMPPKSTWFEPKLRDGLLVHEI